MGPSRVRARAGPRKGVVASRATRADDATMDTVVVLNQDQMGHGDRALGQRILQTFLQKSIALPGFTAILFYNSGVKLVADGSPVLAELRSLEERGVDLVPCGTCLNHYALTPAVGKVANMDAILAELGRAAKVITL